MDRVLASCLVTLLLPGGAYAQAASPGCAPASPWSSEVTPVGFSPIDPIQLLIWSAVLNGVVAVPIMAVMMLIASSGSIMGRFPIRPLVAMLGWIATALMGLTVVALFWSMLV